MPKIIIVLWYVFAYLGTSELAKSEVLFYRLS